MPHATHRPIVLLAEDSEDDAFFFRRTLKKCGLECQLLHALDGAQAIRLLEAAAGPDGRRGERCPDLVFLDLKMPTLAGFEVLAWIRDHLFVPPLDAAVLSGSEHASDVQRAKELGASAYYVKPLSLEQLRARFAAWQEQRSAFPANAHDLRAPIRALKGYSDILLSDYSAVAIVAPAMQQMGGTCGVESALGEGGRFRREFPAAE